MENCEFLFRCALEVENLFFFLMFLRFAGFFSACIQEWDRNFNTILHQGKILFFIILRIIYKWEKLWKNLLCSYLPQWCWDFIISTWNSIKLYRKNVQKEENCFLSLKRKEKENELNWNCLLYGTVIVNKWDSFLRFKMSFKRALSCGPNFKWSMDEGKTHLLLNSTLL